MAGRVGRMRRLLTVARWPIGMALTSWRYLWRLTPLHRSEGASPEAVLPPPLPDGVPTDGLQTVEDGRGHLYWRRYHADIDKARLGPEQLIAAVAHNPNRAAPVEVAVFRKTRGEEDRLRVGDEYLVRMPGPWDGPVRVVDVQPASFRLATMQGHLEAGQIEFRARTHDGLLRFEIESWTRAGGGVVAWLYDRVRLVKEMQLHMWTHFCERAAKLARGRLRGGVHVRTQRCPAPDQP